MMTATIYNESTGEARTIPHVQADHLVRNSRGEWSFAKPLPAGLEPRSAALSHLNGPGAVTVRAPSAGTAVHVLDRREHVAVRRAPDRRRRGARDHPLAACEHDPAERERAADPRILQVASEVADAAIPWRAGRLFLEDGLSGAVPQERLVGRRPEPAVPSPIRAIAR